MAYVSQENKKEKHAELKKFMPKSWKWSLSVNHHSTLVLTIWSAPVDLLSEFNRVIAAKPRPMHLEAPHWTEYAQLNPYHIQEQFDVHALLMKRIRDTLNVGNHDRSDVMTDYFDVGWYVDINLGRYGKPFKVE